MGTEELKRWCIRKIPRQLFRPRKTILKVSRENLKLAMKF
jgi:hypothetical protein